MSSEPGYLHIRAMGLGDILDGAIRLYRYNFGPFLGIVAVAWAPALALQLYATYWLLTTLFSEQSPEMSLQWLAGAVGGFGIAFALVYFVAIPVAQGALIWAVSKRYLGQSAGIAQSYQVVLQRFGHVLFAIVLTSLVVLAGTLACILPGMVLSVLFVFAIPEVVLNRCTAVEAMGRSWELVRYDFWKVLLTMVVLGLLVSLIATALSAPFSWLVVIPLPQDKLALLQVLSGGMRSLIHVIVQPVYVIGTILLYYDLRIRKEGFDVQLLAEAVEQRDGPYVGRPVGEATSLLLSPDRTPLPPDTESDGDR